MSRVDWGAHPEYDRHLLALKDTGNSARAVNRDGSYDGLLIKGRSFAEVAAMMNQWFNVEDFTKDSVQKRWKDLTDPPGLRDFPQPVPTPYLSSYFDPDGKPRLVAEKRDWQSRVAELFDSGRWTKTLDLSDTQGLACNDELLARAIDDHPDADIIVLPGDVCDWEGASRYTHIRDYPLMHEADWYVRLLVTLTERYPDAPVIVTNSNHRRRVENAIRTLPQGLLFLAEHNPERYLAQPFANVHALEPWWVQLGDVIHCHKEGKTAIPGNNVMDAIDSFLLWERSGQFPIDTFRTIISGHSHKLANVMYQGVQGIEPGTLATLPMQPYMVSASTRGIHENGYAIAIQKGGHVDTNATRYIRFSAQPSLRDLR